VNEVKIVIFGTGLYYKNRKKYFPSDVQIIAFIDNAYKLEGIEIEGIKVYSPYQISRLSFDRILLMSKKTKEMKEQLIEIGIPLEKIWYWIPFYADMQRGRLRLFSENTVLSTRKKVLVIATRLTYDGSTMAAIHAISALLRRGYSAVLAAPEGNESFIDEMKEKGIVIIICPALRCIHKEELLWIRQFDAVIVNTFVMMPSACGIASSMPVVWWIHECSDKYGDAYNFTKELFWQYDDKKYFSNINVCAVSNMAKENFNYYYPNVINAILPYGILDRYEKRNESDLNSKIIFSVIGNICVRKGQKILLDAIELLDDATKADTEFWIIGNPGAGSYSDEVIKRGKQISSVKILGELSRDQIHEAYKKIDVVICPSLEETMSIVVTEGMMYGKVCITSDMTGMADYIIQGENGLICKTGDARDLCNKISYIVRNREYLYNIGNMARKTYEEFFTIDKFADRIEKLLKITIEKYEKGI